MANVKITELAAVTTIIPGTDVVPIINGGSTKKSTPLQLVNSVLNGTTNLGIGTSTPSQKLSVVGIIESTVGGVKFPDGTIQTSAAGIYIATTDLSWDSATDTYTRSNGLATTQTITNIHLKMRRCLLMDDGTVNYYLNSVDSTLKAIGGSSNLSGIDGQVMVEIPKFYVKYSRVGTVNTWAISEVPYPDYVLHPAFIKDDKEVSNRYIGAYDACVNTTGTTYQSGLNYAVNVGAGQLWDTGTAKLSSVSGIYPAVGITRNQSRLMAANRGTGWRQQDFFLVSAIQLLYLIEYGSFNSQSKIGAGNTGVSTGYVAASGVQTDSPHSIAGKSNAIGNATGAVASSTRDTAWMSYRGIENFFGNCSGKFVDGININTHQAYVTSRNQRSYYADDTMTNHTAYGALLGVADGWVTNIVPESSSFLPSSVGGGSSTYLTDYYRQTATGYQAAVFGGCVDNGSSAGVFFWIVNVFSALAFRNLGARLAF
jgi:hypothetical protein